MLRPVDRVEVTAVIDNATDLLLGDRPPVRRAGPAGPVAFTASDVAVGGATLDVLRAEHGYSALVDVHAGGRVNRVLYDAGVSTDGLVGNLGRLGVAPEGIEAVVLSHGHFDHVAGLHGLLGRTRPGVPLLVHPDVWTRRRFAAAGAGAELPTPSRRALEDGGFAIVERAGPSLVLDGSLLVTGGVPRVTAFETGMPAGHEAWSREGWRPDPWIRDDQALVAHVRGRGLVIVTGCGHAGIVNIVRYARELTGVDEICLLAGGLHLRDRDTIAATVRELVRLRPELIVPAHCTSREAHEAIAAALPGAYHPGTVGCHITLDAVAPLARSS